MDPRSTIARRLPAPHPPGTRVASEHGVDNSPPETAMVITIERMFDGVGSKTAPSSSMLNEPLERLRDRSTTSQAKTRVETQEEQSPCAAGTETGDRSPARLSARTSSPATSPSTASKIGTPRAPRGQAGRGSLGVLMPTLLPTKATFTGRNSADLGALTHALIGAHVQFLHPTPTVNPHHAAPRLSADEDTTGVTGDDRLDDTTLDSVALPGDETGGVSGGVPGDLLHRIYVVAYAVIKANPNATRVLATEAASLAYRYLCEFPPAPPWRLLAIEYDTGNGEVDVAWQHEVTREVFFDEVKTSRVTDGRVLSPAWAQQAARYTAAGHVRFGDLFLGTRLVPLMAANTARLFAPSGPPVILASTETSPLRTVQRKPAAPGARP